MTVLSVTPNFKLCHFKHLLGILPSAFLGRDLILLTFSHFEGHLALQWYLGAVGAGFRYCSHRTTAAIPFRPLHHLLLNS